VPLLDVVRKRILFYVETCLLHLGVWCKAAFDA
jgi:hypothetical protein